LDLRQLEHFVAVAEERHFTRAAQRLNIVQSGLSATIRALEAELGGKLFVRNTRNVLLTPAGELLLDHALRILAGAREARLSVSQVCGLARGRLSIGAIGGLAPFIDLPASLGRFHQAYPGVDISLSVDGSAALLDEVRDDHLDIAFTQPPEVPIPGVATRLITCEGMVAVCSPRHPLAGAREVTLEQLSGETFVDLRGDWPTRRLVDRSFATRGLTRRIALEVNDMDMLLGIAGEGLAVALAPESVAHARRQAARGQLPGIAELCEADEPCWELAAAFKGASDEPESPVARAFLDCLVAVADPPR
jgi:DNA-binding transcriptional LysR family regulator